MNSEDTSLTGDNRKMLTKITRSCPTMHCFTAAPFRKLVFQKGTEPSCTSSTLLVKGKGHWDPRAPSLQHLPFLSADSLLSPLTDSVDFFFFFTSLFFFPTKMEKKDTWMCSFSEEISFCWGSNKHELLILTEYYIWYSIKRWLFPKKSVSDQRPSFQCTHKNRQSVYVFVCVWWINVWLPPLLLCLCTSHFMCVYVCAFPS